MLCRWSLSFVLLLLQALQPRGEGLAGNNY